MFGYLALAARVPVAVECGDIKIQILSPSLFRLEKKGPKGFEDRATFNVVNRDIGSPRFLSKASGNEIEIKTPRFIIRCPKVAHSLSEVKVTTPGGETLYQPKDEPVPSQFLPAPGKMPKTWAMSDYPRLVQAGKGWDRGNNATDLYVFVPTDYQNLRHDFLALTGPTEKPPLYALGFIDSRYHPYTEQEALGVIDTYRKKRIPLDMFVVDTDWRINGSHGYEVESKYFPDMPRFMREAHDRNVRLMFNDHPDPVSPDPLSPKELEYRRKGLTKMLGMGLDVWWYDRNWSTSLGEPLPGLRKEVWGQWLYRTITLDFRPELRPLIMTNFQGIDNGYRSYAPQPAGHRYPMWWTGDTRAEWEFLQRGVQNGVDMGVLALTPFLGEDLGGHVGQPSPELYVRYLQYGCLSPTTRVHCTRGETRYPWEYGPQAERIVTDYARLRYRLMPTLYSAAHQAYEDGTPLLRRCDLEWPTYAEAAHNDQYMLGGDLLVAPIISSESETATPIPTGGLKAEFFKGVELAGEPVLTRTDSQLSFDWGEGAPAAGVPEDRFSARWTGETAPAPKTGTYTIVTHSDDGIRLWFDGRKVVDAWRPQNNEVHSFKVQLEAGSRHTIRLEYYEGTGNARIKLAWIPPSDRPDGETKRDVWIPPGQWRSVYTGETVQGPRTVSVSAPLWQCPMWARAGGLITLAPEMQYTGEKPWDSLTLEAFALDRNGTVRRELVEDDGTSNEYLRNKVERTEISQTRQDNQITLTIGGSSGSFRNMPASRKWRVRLNLPVNGNVREVSIDGRPTREFQVVSGTSRPGAPLQGGNDARGRVLIADLPTASVRKGRTVTVWLR
ncbi:TIM-barrel domain-containing protein [Fimbriimonas ginsengisoli]|uniref:Glucan 1,4-beta-glucosidase n=1 Tax=Fimbriimonas ginsengisoli Gsoil 348 TaxID=661478 RepID=A0A068NQ40_FIMGI|nr:TIM-barrel domain-containing protein [Fimbriimonas ginsengisoli]AIE84875.1 glucan 1,4-beta-glucosidase [Fimbriimonas ginsengisoli Gsoil 348]